MSPALSLASCWQRAKSTSRHTPKPTGSAIVGRTCSSELTDGMRCLVGDGGSGEEGSAEEEGVSTEIIEDKTDSHVCISYMQVLCVHRVEYRHEQNW